MTLLQLKILREIERHSLNISAAAKAFSDPAPQVTHLSVVELPEPT